MINRMIKQARLLDEPRWSEHQIQRLVLGPQIQRLSDPRQGNRLFDEAW
jgi:hypothetical protein